MHPFVEFVGVPVVAAGIGNISGFVHAPNENIVVAHFEKGVEYAFQLFSSVAKM
jgi:acetylornithine deacetylase/succinyl-diaminopimelate desuccinylase-like protein